MSEPPSPPPPDLGKILRDLEAIHVAALAAGRLAPAVRSLQLLARGLGLRTGRTGPGA